MSFIYYNPNPENKNDIDCVVRGICKVMDISWEEAYIEICMQGFYMHTIPIVNNVWSTFLEEHGYECYEIEDTCPYCYTVKDFCFDHPLGKYLLAVAVSYADQFKTMDSGRVNGNHVVAVVDGNYYDAWDSGDEVPIYYWKKLKGANNESVQYSITK